MSKYAEIGGTGSDSRTSVAESRTVRLGTTRLADLFESERRGEMR